MRGNILFDAVAPLAVGGVPPLGLQAPPQQPQKMSKGQLIMGILADALSGAQGKPGQFAQQMGKRQDREQEIAQWGLKRQGDLQDYEAKQQIDQRYAKPDVPPMMRDAQAWQTMTPEQRSAYQEMKSVGQGDPDVFITLPNGQVYAGPRSGLAAAMMGGGQAPAAPVGKLTPIQGGPAPAPGGFRP